MPALFPMFIKLRQRRCLVVGGGKIAESKIQSLLAAGAIVRVVAPIGTETVAIWAIADQICWEMRPFEPRDLDSVFLVVAATSSRTINHTVFLEAQRRGVLCNAVDDPEHCDFYYPAVVHRGDLQIAISTSGASPALAQRLRRELEAKFGPEYEDWLQWLRATRETIFAADAEPARRRRLLHQLAGRDSFRQYVRSRPVNHQDVRK